MVNPQTHFKTRKALETEIVLVISGSMTGDAERPFEKALDGLQNSACRTIILDLSPVPDVSSLLTSYILQVQNILWRRTARFASADTTIPSATSSKCWT